MLSHGDINSCAAILELCASTKNLKKTKQLHARLVIAGISSHDFLRTKLVSSYVSCAQMLQASHIFSLANRRSTFLFNTLIRGFSSLKLFPQALAVFRQMLREWRRVDHLTLPVVLRSCAGTLALRLGRQVHATVLANGFDGNVANGSALVTMYVKCGDLVAARRVFDGMPERNVVAWTAMMQGYGMHGRSDEVFRLFDGMLVAGLSPDAMTFTALLTACSHCGLCEKGREFFQVMQRRFAVRPRVEHYTCMVDLLGRAGLVEEAEELILGMEANSDEALWRALLSACKMHAKSEVAERLAEKLYGRQICPLNGV